MGPSFCKIERRPLKRLNGNRNIPTNPISKLYHYLTYIISLFTAVNIFAQYPEAPEKWSIPEKIEVISEWAVRSESPSISFDKQKLYFDAGGIAVTEWGDTVWSEPYGLNSNINQHLVRNPCISPNGKRLFFTWFWPGWDLYYSDWDSTTNDWGIAVNCGVNVNDPTLAEIGCTLPNDTTLIFLRANTAYISYLNSQTGTWGPAERWPTPTLWFQSDWGIYVSPSLHKVYDIGSRTDTTISGEWYLNYDINVSYEDSTNPRGYTIPYILNFCLFADTQYFAGNYEDRFEGFPTLTPDGKKMYITATYHGQTTIYESKMLIDENGNPVGVEDEYESNLYPQQIELFPAYPNPFNPSTTIKYDIAKSGKVELVIYDVLGNKIKTVVNEFQNPGNYNAVFDASRLASGVYLYQLKVNDFVDTKKMILLK